MSTLNILHFPDNKLRQKGKDIEVFDSKLSKIAKILKNHPKSPKIDQIRKKKAK